MREASASESLMTCRKPIRRCRNRGVPLSPGSARENPEACPSGIRHVGGAKHTIALTHPSAVATLMGFLRLQQTAVAVLVVILLTCFKNLRAAWERSPPHVVGVALAGTSLPPRPHPRSLNPLDYGRLLLSSGRQCRRRALTINAIIKVFHLRNESATQMRSKTVSRASLWRCRDLPRVGASPEDRT